MIAKVIIQIRASIIVKQRRLTGFRAQFSFLEESLAWMQ